MYIFKQCAPGLISRLSLLRGRCDLITCGVEKAKQTAFKINIALFLSGYGLSVTFVFAVGEASLSTRIFLQKTHSYLVTLLAFLPQLCNQGIPTGTDV